MRLFFLLNVFFLGISANSQFIQFYTEPLVGVHFNKTVKSKETPYSSSGMNTVFGFKSSIAFGDIGALSITRGITSIQYPELFFQASARANIYHPKEHLTFFVETGIHLSEYDDLQLPVYLGLINSEDKIFSWVTRVLIPTGLDTHLFDLNDSHHFGIELGLQINLLPNRPKKPIQRFGNPFVLI